MVETNFPLKLLKSDPSPAELQALPGTERRLYFALRDSMNASLRIDLYQLRKRVMASRVRIYEALFNLHRGRWIELGEYTYQDETGLPIADRTAQSLHELLSLEEQHAHR